MSSGIYLKEESNDEILSIGDSDDSYEKTPPMRSFGVPPVGASGPALGTDMLINRKKVNPEITSLHSSISGSLSETTEETDYSKSEEEYPSRPQNDNLANRVAAERQRMDNELTEKQEILYQLERLEAKGIRLPKKYTMQHDLDEMKAEYHRLKREKEVDASIRFQRRIMIACISGVEYLNDRFDPFDIQLDGFSTHVHENINDYDDVFEELHEKYKGTGNKMAPELRLLMSLGGSAVMYHLTQSMFRRSKVPEVEDVLRSDPNLMKQFQSAAANRMQQSAPGGGGIFGMLGNLFTGNGAGMGAGRPTMPTPKPNVVNMNQPKMAGPSDVDDVIAQINKEIKMTPTQNNRFETISTISDEEITSIIEDTADLGGLLSNSKPRGRKPAIKRTLEL